jgi:hypothetical protein
VDFAILADPECPEDMTAVSPLTTFLGTKFYSALIKGQVYQYIEHWIAAGRPTTYQWPQTPGQPTQGPVTITTFDPCWSVKPRESTTAAQRAKNLAEGRISEFKKYLKSFQVAVSMIQENLSESMNQDMSSNGEYRKAIAKGDLLAMMAALERKAICGHRMEESVVTSAVRSVTDPVDKNHQQKQGESDEAYILRFKRLVIAAHKTTDGCCA